MDAVTAQTELAELSSRSLGDQTDVHRRTRRTQFGDVAQLETRVPQGYAARRQATPRTRPTRRASDLVIYFSLVSDF